MVKPRERINNYNPNNRLKLNKFHQEVGNKGNTSQSRQLKKKERDIERLIAHDKVAPEVKEEKIEELKKVRENLETHKRGFERKKRQEFFMEIKYSGVRLVEQKKVGRMLKKVKNSLLQDPQNPQLKQQEELLLKKMRYITHYPKTLKYVSLFPNNGLTEEVIKFQDRIMKDIEEKHAKDQEFRNKYQQETEKKPEDRRIEKDKFFLVDEE